MAPMADPARRPPPPHGWPTLPRRLWWVLWVVAAPVVALFVGGVCGGPDLRGSEPRTHVYVVDRQGRRRRLANLTGSTMAKVQRNTSLVNYLNHHLRQHLEVPVLVFPVHLRADARIKLRYVGGVLYALLAGVYAWFTTDAPVAKWIIVGIMALLLLGAGAMLWSSVFERAVATPDDLLVRGFLRRRRIPLDRVSRFQERPYQAHLVGGETIPLGGHDHAGVVPGLNQYPEHVHSGGAR